MELPILRGDRMTLRPVAERDIDRLVEIVRTPGVREWWWEVELEDHLREGLSNGGSAFVIEVEGEVAGWLGFDEENDPGYRHAGIDISLHPRFHARGYGPDAIRAVIRWLADERGHDRFTIDPSARNEHAIAAYERVGFRPVGIMRRYERRPDGTRDDGLLMDLLIEELT